MKLSWNFPKEEQSSVFAKNFSQKQTQTSYKIPEHKTMRNQMKSFAWLTSSRKTLNSMLSFSYSISPNLLPMFFCLWVSFCTTELSSSRKRSLCYPSCFLLWDELLRFVILSLSFLFFLQSFFCSALFLLPFCFPPPSLFVFGRSKEVGTSIDRKTFSVFRYIRKRHVFVESIATFCSLLESHCDSPSSQSKHFGLQKTPKHLHISWLWSKETFNNCLISVSFLFSSSIHVLISKGEIQRPICFKRHSEWKNSIEQKTRLLVVHILIAFLNMCFFLINKKQNDTWNKTHCSPQCLCECYMLSFSFHCVCVVGPWSVFIFLALHSPSLLFFMYVSSHLPFEKVTRKIPGCSHSCWSVATMSEDHGPIHALTWLGTFS